MSIYKSILPLLPLKNNNNDNKTTLNTSSSYHQPFTSPSPIMEDWCNQIIFNYAYFELLCGNYHIAEEYFKLCNESLKYRSSECIALFSIALLLQLSNSPTHHSISVSAFDETVILESIKHFEHSLSINRDDDEEGGKEGEAQMIDDGENRNDLRMTSTSYLNAVTITTLYNTALLFHSLCDYQSEIVILQHLLSVRFIQY